ncbi:MAG: DM13 domain-containing protein [Egibacteraceae bacterium]
MSVDTKQAEDTARSRRPVLWVGVGALVVAGVVVVVLVWFQPQRLLFDDVVDDPFPSAAFPAADEQAPAPDTDGPPARDPLPAGDPPAAEQPPAAGDPPAAEQPPAAEDPPAAEQPPAEPVATAAGSFSSRHRYTVVGTATVYQLADGSRTLRLEDFESTNGPGLFVYLTAADEANSDTELDADFVDLGALRGNIGNQNYDIPPEVDLDHYNTVVIWCRPFLRGFGAADLASAG